SRTLFAGLDFHFPVRRLLRQIEFFASQHASSSKMRSLLEQLRPDGAGERSYPEDREYAAGIAALLERTESPEERPPFTTSEEWASVARADLEALDAAARSGWQALLAHSRETDPPRPTRKWLKQAEALLAGIGEEAFK